MKKKNAKEQKTKKSVLSADKYPTATSQGIKEVTLDGDTNPYTNYGKASKKNRTKK